ncbi:MAG: T9SS type A sorting domain-containing protein, partial [Ignavibacteria bacterium]
FLMNNCQAQWVQTNGPNGGNINSFAVSGSNLFIGMYDKFGVYRSTNSGLSWSLLTGHTPVVINALAVSGSNVIAGASNGIYLSTNNGANWDSLNNIIAETLFANGTNVYAGTASGAFRSSNNGANWTNIGLNNQNVTSFTVSGTNLYAGTYGGAIFLSTDNGVSWTRLTNGLTNNFILTLASSGSIIVAGAEHYPVTGGVYLSTNSGTSWSLAGLSNYDIYSLAISGTNILAGTSQNGVYLSTNYGSNWTELNNGMQIPNTVWGLTFSGTNLYANTTNGLFLSTNSGINWGSIGYPNQNISSFASIGTFIFAGGDGAFKSSNNGLNWTRIGLNANVFLASGTNLFAAGGNYVYRSTNYGINWSQGNGLPYYSISALAISGTNLFAGFSLNIYTGKVYRSTNYGSSWTDAGLISWGVKTLAFLGTTIFAGTNNGLFLSTNNGANWNTSGFVNTDVLSLAVSGNNIFAGTGGSGVYISTNNGTSWTAVNYGLPSSHIYALTYSSPNLFAGASWGVFRSSNNGASWININQGINVDPSFKSLYVTNDNIFAGITSSGVWRRPLSNFIGINNISREIPAMYSLGQNYPNPFNSTSNLKFQIVNSGDVKIIVYDIMGKEVQTLVNERLQPGTYEAAFDGSVLNSGVYFYKLITNTFSETKKMLLIK